MKKKEFAIGETFQFGLKKLKAIKEGSNGCDCCALSDICSEFLCRITNQFVGPCDRLYRSDGIGVIFVEVEDEE